jgi:hypothetical protein
MAQAIPDTSNKHFSPLLALVAVLMMWVFGAQAGVVLPTLY